MHRMFGPAFFILYPSRLLWFGTALLSGFFFLGLILFGVAVDRAPLSTPQIKKAEEVAPTVSLSLQQPAKKDRFEIPSIGNELLFFLSPPFPGEEQNPSSLQVEIKKGNAVKSLFIPARLHLSFNDFGNLEFQEGGGSFWVDLSLNDPETLLGLVTVVVDGKEFQSSFLKSFDPPPIQKTEEYSVTSPLRMLGDARWRGADLLAQFVSQTLEPVAKLHGSGHQRVEIGSSTLSLSQQEFLVFKEGSWSKIYRNEMKAVMEKPLARIRTLSSHQLEWDVWDEEGVYHRLSSPLQGVQHLQPKPDELIHSLRIRSQKQISCMLEKHCFLLKVGDWVLKEQGRWHIIRTPEEREKVLTGQKGGELFVLEKIEPRQKMVKGHLFFPHRTQMMPLELTATSLKREGDHDSSQKRKRTR